MKVSPVFNCRCLILLLQLGNLVFFFDAVASSSSDSNLGSALTSVKVDGKIYSLNKNMLHAMPYFRALLDPNAYLQAVSMYKKYRGDFVNFSMKAQKIQGMFLDVPSGVSIKHLNFMYDQLKSMIGRSEVTIEATFDRMKNNPQVGPKHIKEMLKSAEKLLSVQSIPNALDMLWASMIKQSLVRPNGKISKAFFSPNEQMLEVILGLIKAEKKEIRIACYAMTNREILCALARARLRGVRVSVVIDNNFAKDRDIAAMREAGSWSYLWARQWFQTKPKMHNKFYIFSDNINNQSILVTGSANCSWSAQALNQENTVVMNDKKIIDQFSEKFKSLRNFSQYVEPAPFEVTRRYAKDCVNINVQHLAKFCPYASVLWQALVRLYVFYMNQGQTDRFGVTTEIESEVALQRRELEKINNEGGVR